jgi:predicted NAD/FAD-binding protein
LKLAVIGSGISGISAAYHLQNNHAVTIFETSSKLGGHSNTITVEDDDAKLHHIDTGFIVYNDRNYPGFLKFLNDLKVLSKKTDMSFSYTNPKDSIAYAGTIKGLIPDLKTSINLQHFALFAKIFKYSKLLSERKENYMGSNVSIYDALKRIGCPERVINSYFSPISSAIWSCDEKHAKSIPAYTFVTFFQNHGLLDLKNRPNWYTVQNGSSSYIERFKSGFKGDILINHDVTSVMENENKVRVICNNKKPETYDAVILATHADISKNIVKNLQADKLNILNKYQYSQNSVILHKDIAYMPNNRRTWASWNVIENQDKSEGGYFQVTYNMNRLQKIKSNTEFLVTVNPIKMPDPKMVYFSTIYSHPVLSYNQEFNDINFQKLNKNGSIFFCGSYFGYGFHEDAFQSGKKVSEKVNLLNK